MLIVVKKKEVEKRDLSGVKMKYEREEFVFDVTKVMFWTFLSQNFLKESKAALIQKYELLLSALIYIGSSPHDKYLQMQL